MFQKLRVVGDEIKDVISSYVGKYRSSATIVDTSLRIQFLDILLIFHIQNYF